MTEKTCSDCLHKDVCEYRFSWLDQEDNTKHIICHKFQDKVDVVSRAEVARAIFEDLESICLTHVDRYNRYLIYSEDFAELKKKYTEEGDQG